MNAFFVTLAFIVLLRLLLPRRISAALGIIVLWVLFLLLRMIPLAASVREGMCARRALGRPFLIFLRVIYARMRRFALLGLSCLSVAPLVHTIPQRVYQSVFRAL